MEGLKLGDYYIVNGYVCTARSVCKRCEQAIFFQPDKVKWVGLDNDWHCQADDDHPVRAHTPS